MIFFLLLLLKGLEGAHGTRTNLTRVVDKQMLVLKELLS